MLNKANQEASADASKSLNEVIPTHLRVRYSMDSLMRYGSGPAYDEITCIIEELAEMNDDLSHSRDTALIHTRVETIRKLLNDIVTDYNRHCNRL